MRNKGLNLSHAPLAGEDWSLCPEVHGAIHSLVHSLMMYWMPTVCRAFRCVGWAAGWRGLGEQRACVGHKVTRGR